MTAHDGSLSELITKLSSSLESASKALPDDESVLPPDNGISLLDVKAELFLSYIQNLAFLILVKLRSQRGDDRNDTQRTESGLQSVNDEVVKKLVELRVYLERGVRPLEGRLKYQIDKVVRAADTAERNAAQKATPHSKKTIRAPTSNENGHEGEDSGSASESGDRDSDVSELDELSYKPNLASFTEISKPVSRSKSSEAKGSDVYRPPRITPTVLPGHNSFDDKARTSRKPQRSRTIDDFIDTEISNAPVVEPSIGSTIVSGGRRTVSGRERREEDERRAYEEANYVRLPPRSKKEKATPRSRSESGFGGEDFRYLKDGLDRINRLTSKRTGARSINEGGPTRSGSSSRTPNAKRRKVGRR